MVTSGPAESFRDLLLRYRGRSRLTQRQLAERLGVHRRSVQEWENGATYPSPERLEALLRVLLAAHGLMPGQESAEAKALWAAVQRGAPHTHAPFDATWFARLVAQCATPAEAPAAAPAFSPPVPTPRVLEPGAPERRQDWGEAPATISFVGRTEELATLRRWAMDERCRLVAILGMGGIGKTTLTAKLAQDVAGSFERVYWRSLRDAPAPGDWLAGAIGFLSDQQLVPPTAESDRRTAVLQLLRERRCLLVLDNVETLFEPGLEEGRYRAGLEGYGRLLQAVGGASHQSCLVLTSREAPPELATLSANTGPVRALALEGLGLSEGRALLGDGELWGDDTAWSDLIATYGGNGLALKVAGGTIGEVFGGDIAAFMAYVKETYGSAVRSIRRVMESQIERRLSPVELDVLRRLAIEREPVTLAALMRDVGQTIGRGAVLEGVESLRRRSLLERAELPGVVAFTLQSVVLEYVTDRLVEVVTDEIKRGQPEVLVEQPLITAQAKDYVRQTQERLIGEAILQKLNAQDDRGGTERCLLTLLEGWRDWPPARQGYGPGNVVNLLRLLRGDLRGLDLSRLAIRQAYLAGVGAQDASLAHAQLTETALADGFDYPTAVALSADGASLVVGTSTGELRLWRAADRTLLARLEGHTGQVQGVALSPTGDLVASGGVDGTVRLLETSTGRLLATLRGHTGGVRTVALSADGRLLASGGEDGTVRLWEASSGRLQATLEGCTGGVWGVALSATGEVLASGGFDGTLRLWETTTGRLLASSQGHTGGIWRVALSARGDLVATGGADGTVRLWEASSGRLLQTLQGYTGGVRGVALSPNGDLVATGGADGTVRLWETGSGQPVATVQGHTGGVWGVAVSADRRSAGQGGHLLVSGSEDGRVRLWEATSGRLLATLEGSTGGVWAVALSATGQEVASGGFDGTVRLWEASTGRLLATLHGHTGGVRGVALSARGDLLASGGGDGLVRLWDFSSGQPLATLQGHRGGVRAVAISADGHLLASGGADGTVRLWEVNGGRLLASLEGHTGAVWGVALSPDGQLVVSGGADGTVRLWDARSGRPLATLQGDTGGVPGVAVSADPRSAGQGGDLLASGGGDGLVRLWEVSTGRLLASLEGHTSMVRGVALSADGHLVASGGFDGTVRLWDAKSGACLCTLQPERRYERLDITGLTGVTAAQRSALLALGALEQHGPTREPTATW